MKLTKEAAQSFANLRSNPDFAVVLKWMQGHRTAFRDKCSTASGKNVYRAQGAVEAVDGFIAGYKEAPQITEKFKSQM